jgi:hypothetical protein
LSLQECCTNFEGGELQSLIEGPRNCGTSDSGMNKSSNGAGGGAHCIDTNKEEPIHQWAYFVAAITMTKMTKVNNATPDA